MSMNPSKAVSGWGTGILCGGKSWQFVLLIWAGLNTLCGGPQTAWDLRQILMRRKTKPYGGEVLRFHFNDFRRSWTAKKEKEKKKTNPPKPNPGLCKEHCWLAEMTRSDKEVSAFSPLECLDSCRVLRKSSKKNSQVRGKVMPSLETETSREEMEGKKSWAL